MKNVRGRKVSEGATFGGKVGVFIQTRLGRGEGDRTVDHTGVLCKEKGSLVKWFFTRRTLILGSSGGGGGGEARGRLCSGGGDRSVRMCLLRADYM